MSDRELSVLLDRAVHHAPQMHLTGADMLAAGKGRVRRRRAVGVGGVAGAAVLVAALWGGLAGGGGTLLGTTEIQPAGHVWDDGEAVDGTLFAGLQTIGDDGVAHSYAARLTRAAGGQLTLVLSDGGEVLEEVRARSTVPGLEVFAGERMTIALWAEPEGVEVSVPLVGPVDPGGPSSVQRTEVSGEQVAYAVWAGDVVDLPGSVDDVYLVGRDEVVSLTGAAVESDVLRAGDSRAVAWADTSRGVWGYAVDGQDDAVVEQLGHRPAHAGSYLFAEDDWSGVVTVLPDGAVPDAAAAGSRTDSVTLGERAVVLAGIEDPGSPPVPFTLDGTSFLLDPYLEDLMTLETGDGGALTVEVSGGSVALSDGSGASPVELTQEVPRPGVDVHTVRGEPIVVVTGWDPGSAVLTSSRVEVSGPDGLEWVEPRDVAQVAMPDGALVTLLTIDASLEPEVAGVGLQVGDVVERWAPAVALGDGVTLLEEDGVLVLTVDGRPLPRVDDGSLGDIRHVAARGEDGYLVVPDSVVDRTLVPVTARGTEVRLASDAVVESYVVERPEGDATVLRVSEELVANGRSTVAALASSLEGADGAVNTWQLLGAPTSAHVVVDPGAVVSITPDLGVWLLYPEGSTDVEDLEVGRVGGSALELRGGGAGSTLVAVHPSTTPTSQVKGPGGRAPAETHDVTEGDLQVHVWPSTGRDD